MFSAACMQHNRTKTSQLVAQLSLNGLQQNDMIAPVAFNCLLLVSTCNMHVPITALCVCGTPN